MPDKYDTYSSAPRSGGSGYQQSGTQGRAQGEPINPSLGSDRPRTRPVQTGSTGARPAGPAQSGEGMSPSLGYQTRPAGYNYQYGTRPGTGSSSGAQTRASSQGPARTGSAQTRTSSGQRPYQSGTGRTQPSSGTRTNASGSAQRRPSQSTGTSQTRRAPSSSASGRSGYSGTQRSSSPYSGDAAARASQTARRQQTSGRNVRSSGGYGYAGESGGGGGMSPVTKGILAILCMALLITICLAITSKIRAAQPQPGISLSVNNTQQPVAQETQQPTDAPTSEPTEVPTEAPAQTEEPAPVTNGRSATIRAIGDVIISQDMLDNAVQDKKNDVYFFSPLFELAADVMADADWTMINIEASLRKHKYGYMGYPQFCTPHSILNDLKAVGVDMLTMCNNHALDNYFDGLKMGLDYADAAGLAHVGAYRTQEEHDTPEVYDINGIKIGMLNYTQFTNGMAEKSDKAATEYGMRLMDGADYEGDIADLKRAGAEFVVAIMHWGEEYQRQPESSTRSVAKRLVAAGADLVIGGHPHVVQPAEYVTATLADGTQKTALVVYSIGNFVSDHRHENTAYTDNGVIFEFTVQENAAGEIEMVSPAFIPIYMWQAESDGPYEYRAVPSGVYMDNPPAGMSIDEYSRMCDSWNEIVNLVGGVVPVIAE